MTDKLTADEIESFVAEAEARCEAAVYAPWHYSPSYKPPLKGDGTDVFWGYSISGSNENGGSILPTLAHVHNFPDKMEANANFIAHARADQISPVDQRDALGEMHQGKTYAARGKEKRRDQDHIDQAEP